MNWNRFPELKEEQILSLHSEMKKLNKDFFDFNTEHHFLTLQTEFLACLLIGTGYYSDYWASRKSLMFSIVEECFSGIQDNTFTIEESAKYIHRAYNLFYGRTRRNETAKHNLLELANLFEEVEKENFNRKHKEK